MLSSKGPNKLSLNFAVLGILSHKRKNKKHRWWMEVVSSYQIKWNVSLNSKHQSRTRAARGLSWLKCPHSKIGTRDCLRCWWRLWWYRANFWCQEVQTLFLDFITKPYNLNTFGWNWRISGHWWCSLLFWESWNFD